MITKIKSIISANPIFNIIYGKYQNRIRRVYNDNKNCFTGKKGVEIGGPSKIFNRIGPIPIYPIVKSLDNINFSNDNFWSSINEGYNFKYDDLQEVGKQIIADGIDLSKIPSETYELMLSSHVLEHIANPLKALFEWKRILKNDGYLVIVLPNMDFTYDRKRPLTTLEHIIKDFENNVTEDDRTHLQEVLDLHDLTNDGTVNSYKEHAERTLNNFQTRIVHHHTFRMKLVLEMLNYCGFKIIDFQDFRPYHLLAIVQKVSDVQIIDNESTISKV